jgi:hypothetical protein
MVRSKAESLISVIRKLRGKVDKVEQIKPGDYRVSSGDTAITVNGDVHTLMKDPIIHAGIVQLFTAPMGQEGVTAIETYLKNDRLGTEVKVDKNEAQAFAAFGGTVVPEIDPTREIDTPAVHYLLHPKRLSAEGEPNGWSFRWGKDILSIDKILDKDFLDRVKSGEYRLSSNDLIDAEVVVKQKVSGTKILHESKEIVRIADYKPAPPNPQKDLFLPEV